MPPGSTAPRHLALLLALLGALTLYRVWLLQHLGLDLFVDESQYWFWSTELAWGYYSKPPAIALLIKVSGWLLGDGPLAVKAPALLLQALIPLLAYAIGARMAGSRIGLWAALAVATAPIAAGLALFATTDSPLILCWLLACWALLRALERDHWSDWLLLGAAIGLGLLSKYTMLAFGASAALTLLLVPRGRAALRSPRPWVAALLALALFAPNVAWNASLGFPTFQHVSEITHDRGSEGGWGTLGEFIAAQWLLAGPVFASAALVALLRWRSWLLDSRATVLTMAAVPLLAIGLVQAWRGGANANWAAPALVVAVLLGAVLLGRAGRWKMMAAGVAVNVVIAALVLHWPDLVEASGRELTARIDPYKRMRGWSGLMAPVRTVMQQHPDATVVAIDRELLSQLAYYVRPARFAAWHPGGAASHHYELTRPLPNGYRGDVLLVHYDRVAEIEARFDSAETVLEHRVRVEPGLERRVEVTLLRGFKGYR